MKPPVARFSWTLTAALAAGVLALFAPGLLLGRLPVFRDLLVLVAPLRTYAAEAVRSGRLPLWTPDIFFGAPFLANYQSAVLYPPSAILYALPLVPGLTLFLAFHVFAGGWGMALYLRRRRGLEPLPALFGGVLFALGGFLVSLVSLTNQLEVAVWLPWALDAAEDLQRTGRGRSLARLTFFFALQALGGAPEAWLVSIAVVAANGLLVAWEPGARRWRLLLPGAAIVLAAGLAAPQLASTFEYVTHTDRASTLPLSAVAAESLTPVSFLQFVLPHRFFSGSPGFLPEHTLPLFWSLYLGVAALAFALVALARAPFSLWTIVLAASTLLALGSSTPLFGLLYELAPEIVGAFRFPGKLFLGAHFALCLLAAEGLALAMTRPNAARAAMAVSAAVFVFAATIAISAPLAPAPTLRALGYALPAAMAPGAYAIIAGQVAGTALRSAAFAGCVVALLSFLGRRALSASATAAGLCLITAVDLVTVHQPSLVFADWKRFEAGGGETAAALGRSSRVFHYCTAAPGCLPVGAPGLGSWKGSLPLGENVVERAFHLWSGLVFDVPLAYGLGAVDGGDGFLTRDQGELFHALIALPRASALGVLAALGVDRLIGPEPLELPGLREILARADPPLRAYAVSGAAPRSYLAERLLAAADVPSAFAMLGSPEFRPGRDAVLVASEASPASGGQIRDSVFLPESIAATLSLPGPGLWVVNDSSYPGWEATLDGALVEILRVNAIARGVRVPAGEHRVEMLYRPWWLRWGWLLTALSAAGLVAVARFSR